MGAQDIVEGGNPTDSATFSEELLADLRALEQMLNAGIFESDTVRIGAEQEMFLVDRAFRPAPVGQDVLALLDDSIFTTEIGKFNIEANLGARVFQGDCLRSLENDLRSVVEKATAAAQSHGADVLLTGVLPSVRLADLTLDNLTDEPRYRELNRTVMNLRGGSYNLLIKGIDELQLTRDNVMPEACCSSFQVHLQLDPRRFATQYNASLLATAPVLAAAVNSPLLLGQRLWKETRVALFQHSIDERTHSHITRQHPTRVTFGEGWVEDSVLEIYREQVARFRVLMTSPLPDEKSGVPELKALMLHNGTVWRWNRPCYGITDGKPHLRVEFRCLPSGPTVLDEVANAAFFLGLTTALPEEYGDISKMVAFDGVKENFFAAARHRLMAQLTWLDGKHYASGPLILEQLLPLAEAGLKKAKVDCADIDRYLGTIRERTRRDQTGSSWILGAVQDLSGFASQDSRDRRIVGALLARQRSDEPVHRWNPLTEAEMEGSRQLYQNVADIMSTDLFTIAPEDPVTLAASTMTWRHIRHLPVEDAAGQFVGLISSREILTVVANQDLAQGETTPLTVREVMCTKPITVSPDTSTVDAVRLMLQEKLDCLPVLKDSELVGIISTQDMILVLSCLLGKPQANKKVSAVGA
jgi:CBS domain-containing protein